MRTIPVVVALVLTGCGEEDSADVAALADRVDALETDLADAEDRIGTLQTDLAASTARVAALEAARDELEDDLAAEGLLVTNLQTDVGSLETDVGSLETEVGSLQTDVGSLQTDLGTLVSDVGALQGRWITEDTIWTVGSGQTYATLEGAWDAALQVRIMPDASLTLYLVAGNYGLSEGLRLAHPDGDLVSIMGVSSNTVFVTTPTDGFMLYDGHHFGTISNLTVSGVGDSTVSGIAVYGGAEVNIEDIVFEGFYSGIYASGGLINGGDVDSHDNDYGVLASNGARVTLISLDASDNGTPVSVTTGALLATNGALDITGATAYTAVVTDGGIVSGFDVTSAGSTTGIKLEGNAVWTGTGGTYSGPWLPMDARKGSYANFGGATVQNTSTGAVASWNAVVNASGATFTNVTTEGSTMFGGQFDDP